MKSTRTLKAITNPRTELPFLFDSYCRLAADLGRVDALASAIVLSTRFFTDAATSSGGEQAFAVSQAIRFQVGTRWVSFKDLPPHTAQLLLVGVYQQAEGFFSDVKEEAASFGRVWRNKEKGESPLLYLLDCIKDPKVTLAAIAKSMGTERVQLFEYYRILRNGFVHLEIERERLSREYKRVQKYRGLVKRDYGLDAPNDFANLTYDDFLLFTRLAKYIATDVCILSVPKGSELVLFLKSQEQTDAKPLSKFRARLTPQTKAVAEMRSWFKGRYLFDLQGDPVAEREIIDHLRQMPNKKARKR